MRFVVAGFLFLFLCATGSFAQEDAVPHIDSGAPQHVFRLEPVEEGLSGYARLSLRGQEFVFKNEPRYEGRTIKRFGVPVGPGKKDAIGCAWDVSAAKLYVDLNRNMDLTDDPEGVFVGEKSLYGQGFEGVRFTAGEGLSQVTYVCTVSFATYSLPTRCSISISSGWRGDIELHGRKWTVGFWDNMDGVVGEDDDYLTVEPAEWAEKGIAGASGRTRWREKQAFWHFGGRTYNLALALADGPLELTVTEASSPLGALALRGESVECLVLDGPVHAFLDRLGPQVELPVGEYSVWNALVSGGTPSTLFSTYARSSVTITTEEPAVLQIGGPLRHRVHVDRFFDMVTLECSLKGVGGNSYDEHEQGNPPSFTISQNGRVLASGKFEYG